MIGSLLVIAKQPRPGRVKTRLTPPYTPEQAAQLAAAALRDTLAACCRVPAGRHVLVFDGDPAGYRPEGWEVVEQVEGGLDVRLAAAFGAVIGSGPAVLVGMDTPQLQPDLLAPVARGDADAWIGPAVDGGFWAIGYADPTWAAGTIPGVPMSRADTGARQLERLQAAGLSVALLDPLLDVDDAASAAEVARRSAGSDFAACHAALADRSVGEVA